MKAWVLSYMSYEFCKSIAGCRVQGRKKMVLIDPTTTAAAAATRGGCYYKWYYHHSSSKLHCPRYRYRYRYSRSCKAGLITTSDSFEVGTLLATYGFINITSYSSASALHTLPTQDVGQGTVNIRLYQGRIRRGPLRGTPVIFKVYPGQHLGGIEADLMAANELRAHASLQSNPEAIDCQNVQILLGGFETQTGEQWLAFRNDGKYTAADYAKSASEKVSRDSNLGASKFWNPFEREVGMNMKRRFVTKLLQGTMTGLAYLHRHDLLHQSLGPSSIVLNTMVEKEAPYLVPRLRDLAFSVDIRYSEVEGDESPLSEGLWRRATAAGAYTAMEKQAYGIADDIYEAGLLFAYMGFVPFCEAGAMDSLSLRRLLENTFQLDTEAMREYCLADDRLVEGVKFLDEGQRAGWELLQAMVYPNYRHRPIADAVLKHRFWTI